MLKECYRRKARKQQSLSPILLKFVLGLACFHAAGGFMHSQTTHLVLRRSTSAQATSCVVLWRLGTRHSRGERRIPSGVRPVAVAEWTGVSEDLEVDDDFKYRFGGVERLYGSGSLDRLAASKVAVFGIGGVGSWVVETLARSGIGHLTLVDLDEVCTSNINRQVHAVSGEVGRPKIEVMTERIKRINPRCEVKALPCYVRRQNSLQLFGLGDAEGLQDLGLLSKEQLTGLNLAHMDLVIDSVDDTDDKAALISACVRTRTPVVTCGAAGGLVDPTLVRTGDFAAAHDDRLLSKTRKRLRRDFGFPSGNKDTATPWNNRSRKWGITCVFSEELLPAAKQAQVCAAGDSFRACDTSLGSSAAVTGAFGLAAAGHAIRQLTSGKGPKKPLVRIDPVRVKAKTYLSNPQF